MAGAITIGGLAAAAGALVGIGAGSIAAADTMDEAFDTIQIKTGATGKDLQDLQANFKSVFTSFPNDAQTTAGTLATLSARLKATGDDLNGMTGGLLDASRMLGTDAPKSAELFSRVMGDWGVSNENGAGTLDMLFTATQKTGVGFDDVMQKVVQFGAPMRLMGFNLKDSVALFSKWEKEGVNSELVMGSLRIAAGKFADAGKPLKESLLGTFQSIHDNKDATAALAEGMDIFGARAGPDMVAAIREGRFSIDDLTKALDTSGGSIKATAKATEDFPEKFRRIKNSVTTNIAPIGDVFRNLAGDVLDYAEPKINAGLAKVGALAQEWGPKVSGYLKSMLELGDLGAMANKLKDDFATYVWPPIWAELSSWPGRFWGWLTDFEDGRVGHGYDRAQ